MSRLVLGVMGHVDHGKTALVRALTGMETDRLPEEQARGISVALGFAHLRVGDGEADLIDMPGHERFVRTMVSGATGIDAVLLVVDAREGVMPQTREHIDIAALLGVRRAIIAVSRVDAAEPAEAAATGRSAAALVAQAGLQAGAPVAVSARTGAGLEALIQAIAAELAQARARDDDGFPYLPVDRVFSMAGHGTVVTGTLRHGTLAVGDAVEIVPAGIAARVRGLQVHGKRVAQALPGLRVAVNLRHVEPAQVMRGAALAAPGALPASDWLSVRVRSVPDAPVLATTQKLLLLFGTEEVEVRLRLLDCETLQPGETAYAQLRCAAPMSVPARELFLLRSLSPPRTIAGGAVLDPQATRQRRHAPAVLARLDAMSSADPAAIIAAELAGAGLGDTALNRLARLAGLSPAQTAGLLPPAAVLAQGYVIAPAAQDRLRAELPRLLASWPQGVSAARLRSLLPGAGPVNLEQAVAALLSAGVLAREEAALRLATPDQDRQAAARADAHAARLAETIRQAGLTPPDLADIAPDTPRRRLVARLIREGVLIRAPDIVQKREILFHRDAIEQARRQLATTLTQEGKLVGEIGAALGISRKFSVPLLEYLDSVQFTRRIAERRVLAASLECQRPSGHPNLRAGPDSSPTLKIDHKAMLR